MNLILETKEEIKEDEPKEETKETIEEGTKENEPNEEEKEIKDDLNTIISLEEMTKILKEQTPKKIHLIIIISA